MRKYSTTRNFDWPGSIPFLLMHLAALGVFFTPFKWSLVFLCAASYVLRMFGITAGYHRYFAHRSYTLGRVSQFIMAVIGSLAAQKGVLWWAAHHRHHHRFSDQAEDLHSPVQDGFWWSHVGWILDRQSVETRWEQIRDFQDYPELVWLNQYFWVPATVYAVALFLIGGAPWLFWGFFLSTVLVYHGTFTINSLSHVFGTRRYQTSDDSRNNPLLALITLGEGWHNNHHCYMSSARQGFFWWELDLSYLALQLLSALGIVTKLRHPPIERLEARRITSLPAPPHTRSAHV